MKNVIREIAKLTKNNPEGLINYETKLNYLKISFEKLIINKVTAQEKLIKLLESNNKSNNEEKEKKDDQYKEILNERMKSIEDGINHLKASTELESINDKIEELEDRIDSMNKKGNIEIPKNHSERLRSVDLTLRKNCENIKQNPKKIKTDKKLKQSLRNK